MHKNHTVIIVLEAKPGKEHELESELKKVAHLSREESTNIEYRVHRSYDNPQQFILYETWESPEKHKLQFEKPYILEFGSKLKDLTAKPYIAYFSQEIK